MEPSKEMTCTSMEEMLTQCSLFNFWVFEYSAFEIGVKIKVDLSKESCKKLLQATTEVFDNVIVIDDNKGQQKKDNKAADNKVEDDKVGNKYEVENVILLNVT